ncbi:MAG: TonB-dependent receptor, partial [Candidatus Eremiobacteraeota bacterium]|nr:TonB-dependent receptor [Candidatus Eremiobacteraeota bacterium]
MPFLLAAAAACCFLSGHVHDPAGVPISGARIAVSGAHVRALVSDAAGFFSVNVSPGRYAIRISALGYRAVEIGPLYVNRDDAVDAALEPLDSPHLRLIGSVSVNGSSTLVRDAVPTVDLSRSHMEREGADRVIDSLAEVPSVTFARRDGGAATGPSLISLRGPDPSETLTALDGQILNDGNTGDLDLSRFPVAAFSSVNVTEGLGASDSEGSNTIGGAVNLVSLQPTREPHTALSLSVGSFGRSEGWYNASGTRGRLGYGLALDQQTEHGYVDQNVRLQGAPLHLGSAIESRAALANLTYTLSQRASIGFRVFSLGNQRDMSGLFNTPDDPAAQGDGALFDGPGAASFAQTIRSYDLRGRAPLGPGELLAEASTSDNDVTLAGSGISPYDVTHRDKRGTLSLSWERQFDRSSYAFGGYTRNESLDEAGIDGSQHQSIRSYFLRGSVHPSKPLRVQAGLFISNYSTFGSNVDARVSASYDTGVDSAARFSIGTGFRPPLLVERYVFPIADLVPDQNCVYVGQGNPSEKPEHATEYEVGYSRLFRSAHASVDVSLYRTNLRDAIENFYPLAAIPNGCSAPPGTYASFPINVGNVVYQGAELRFTKQFSHVFLNAAYGLNVALPTNLPPSVSNPTWGGNLVPGEQFLNIPQQQASLGLDWENGSWHGALDTTFRGRNNELNQNPYALSNAGIGRRFGNADLTLAATNLFNQAAASKFTQRGAGVPYR